jgi:hypothetical protein
MHKSAARYREVEDEVREFVAGLKVYVTEDLATYYTLTCPGTGVVHTAKDEKLCVMDSIERVLYVARATVGRESTRRSPPRLRRSSTHHVATQCLPTWWMR